MEEKLTQEELLFIEEGIDLYKTLATKILKVGALVTALSTLLGYFILGFSLRDMMLMMLGASLMITYVWYSLFEKPKIRLKQDLEKGIKVVQAVTVNKIKNKKEGKIYQMSNGLEVKEIDFEDDNIIVESIEKGVELILTYTPFHKMILNIKSKSTSPNQV